MKKTYFSENTIVGFHIGRGGHVEFRGECMISDFAEDCFSPSTVEGFTEDGDPIFVEDERPEAEWKDCNGNSVGLTNAEYKSGIGRIDLDGEYNTYYTMRLGNIEEGDKEWDAIFADNSSDAEDCQRYFKPCMGIETLDELANFINENEDWQNDIDDIIVANSWVNQMNESEWHICHNYVQMVMLNDECEAIVKEY